MIITPKEPRDRNATSSLSKLVPYMLHGKGEERCTWYLARNLEGFHRREDADLAVDIMELLQDGNVRSKGPKTYHLVISFHPEDRRLSPDELEDVVERAVRAAGLEGHQYIAVRHSEQEHEHLHVAVNKVHPETLRIHHPYKAIDAYQALASVLEGELGLRRVNRTPGHSLNHKARDFEAHHGIESFARWARRSIGASVELDRVGSWDALHEKLARFGVRLVLRGNGLAIVDAERPNMASKASALGRSWSKRRLCARYGDFVPGPGAAEVMHRRRHRYLGRPLERARDDGLWREYQEALGASRIRREELREVLSSKVGAARAAHRRHFKTRYHSIAAMPISGPDKRRLYKLLSFERKAAKRKLEAKIARLRVAHAEPAPGSWKAFLAARALQGDQRAIRRMARPLNAPGIKVSGAFATALPGRERGTSRGTIVHRLPGGVRVRERAGTIELLGPIRDEALERLVGVARQRFGRQPVTLVGSKEIQKRLAEVASERGLEIADERRRGHDLI